MRIKKNWEAKTIRAMKWACHFSLDLSSWGVAGRNYRQSKSWKSVRVMINRSHQSSSAKWEREKERQATVRLRFFNKTNINQMPGRKLTLEPRWKTDRRSPCGPGKGPRSITHPVRAWFIAPRLFQFITGGMLLRYYTRDYRERGRYKVKSCFW